MVWNHRPMVNGDTAGNDYIPRIRLHQAALTGTGRCLPSRIVGNTDFPSSLETNDEWIRTRTGISERRIAARGETSFTLGLTASEQAIQAAGISPRALDLVICATVTPDTMVPSNASRIQSALGCRTIGAFDVVGACTGFLQGITIAGQFIATGSCKHILVVGAEVLSRTLDYQDRTSCILFGDGAGAVVLSATENQDRGIRWTRLFSDGHRGDLIYMPSHVTNRGSAMTDGTEMPNGRTGKYLHLNGREVFKFAVRTMIALVQEALVSVPFESLDRVWLVPHQVNQRIIDAALSELPIPANRVVLNLDRYGNTSAASIPIALDEAVRDKTIGPGDHLILAAFGGGMTWGGAVISL